MALDRRRGSINLRHKTKPQTLITWLRRLSAQHSKNAQLLKFNPTHKLRTLQTASPSEARVPEGYKPRDILLHWYLGRSITTKFYGAQKARTDCKSVDNLTDDYNIKVSSLLFQGLETRPAPSARLMPSSKAEGF